ncbi:MAG: NADH-quinone oxidoreductase subunit NuoE [Rickettsiaceae bacterium]|nr:NADH-quinone oxidoreductase subunit NuoE [Rickettsiaceae bacterium]
MTKNFSFNKENTIAIEQIIKNYPEGRQRSAILPLLTLAQKQNDGWLPLSAIEHVANILQMPAIRVYEVASFYSMFNLKPVGKYHLQICGTTPCYLRGAEKIRKICEEKLNIKLGETTKDNLFTLSEVECLGACTVAPVMQINNEQYYENLDEEKLTELLNKLKETGYA